MDDGVHTTIITMAIVNDIVGITIRAIWWTNGTLTANQNPHRFTGRGIYHVSQVTDSSNMAKCTAERLLFEPENKIYHCRAITSRPHLLYPSVIEICFSADTAGVRSAWLARQRHCSSMCTLPVGTVTVMSSVFLSIDSPKSRIHK